MEFDEIQQALEEELSNSETELQSLEGKVARLRRWVLELHCEQGIDPSIEDRKIDLAFVKKLGQRVGTRIFTTEDIYQMYLAYSKRKDRQPTDLITAWLVSNGFVVNLGEAVSKAKTKTGHGPRVLKFVAFPAQLL